MNGYDPYSNSKSCSELVKDSYRNAFFQDKRLAVSTMRAGNVIGAVDRIVPDCVAVAFNGKDIIVRNPYSVRSFQHVITGGRLADLFCESWHTKTSKRIQWINFEANYLKVDCSKFCVGIGCFG